MAGYSKSSTDYVYFTKGTGIDVDSAPVPDSSAEKRKVQAILNGCETAKTRLNTVGFYTGHIREYKFQGNSGSWQEVPADDGTDIKVLDCWDDIRQSDNSNGDYLNASGTAVTMPDGYPVDGLGSASSPILYTTDVNDSNTSFGTGEVVTLYSANYLRWYKSNSIPYQYRSRIAIAKDVVTDLIESAPAVDFGLQVFNFNAYGENDYDGGRIVFGIQEMTDTARQDLVDIIDDDLKAQTNTPLCESMYEAMRYFGGLTVKYGKKQSFFR